jgi:hypothetical protein
VLIADDDATDDVITCPAIGYDAGSSIDHECLSFHG